MKIGFSELVVVFVVALFVIGPDKLPEYARKLGEALRQFRKASNEMTKDLRESVIEPLEEAEKPLKEAMAPLNDIASDVEKNVKDMQNSVKNIGQESTKTPEPVKNEELVSAAPSPVQTKEIAEKNAETEHTDTSSTDTVGNFRV